MDRLISEQAVLEAFREYQGSISDFYKAVKAIPSADIDTLIDGADAVGYRRGYKEAQLAIPSAEPREVRKGHWIKYDKEYFTTKRLTPVTHSMRECSECHTKIADFCGEMKYCPNCGARMIESQEGVNNEQD